MHPLGILETHLCVLVRLVDTLWLAIENDLLELGGVYSLNGLCHCAFVLKTELEDTLLARDYSSVVSVFLQLRQEPLDDFDERLVVTSRNLMRKNSVWALHLL